MRKIYVLLISFFLVANLSAVAQKNLRSGYIVTLSGDTIHGYIDFKDWRMNPTMVNFKKNLDNENQLFAPNEIKLFCIGDITYEGAFVDMEVSSQESGNYSTSPELSLEKQLVFLQLLIKGRKSLYVNGNAIYEQFYIKSDSTFDLLVYKKYYKDVIDSLGSRKTVIVENKKYQGQLIVYLSDCDGIKNQISNTEYNSRHLQNLFIEYYLCKGQTYKEGTPKRNFAANIGATFGVAVAGIDFEVYKLEKTKRTNHSFQPIGISVELSRPVSHPDWSFYNELTLNRPFKLEDVVVVNQEFNQTTVSTKYSFSALKLVNVLRYKFYSEKKLSFFANAGLATELHMGKWEQKKSGIVIGAKVDYTKNYLQTFTYHKFVVGGGMKYWRCSLEARYETGNSKKNLGPVMSLTVCYTF